MAKIIASDTRLKSPIVRIDSSWAWNVPSRLTKKPGGSRCVAISCRICATTTAMSAAPSVFAITTTRRLPFSRRIWFGPSVSTMSAIWRTGIQPTGDSMSRSARPCVVRRSS